jgi:hypothetical protein
MSHTLFEMRKTSGRMLYPSKRCDNNEGRKYKRKRQVERKPSIAISLLSKKHWVVADMENDK